jgi:hypothetical protein
VASDVVVVVGSDVVVVVGSDVVVVVTGHVPTVPPPPPLTTGGPSDRACIHCGNVIGPMVSEIPSHPV